MERVVALRVRNVWVGIMGNEQMDNIEVPVSCCPLHRRRNQVSSKRIDFRTLLQQIPTRRHLRIDRRPMQRGNVLLVAIRRLRLARLYQTSNGMYVSALRCNENVSLNAGAVSNVEHPAMG